MVILRTLKHIKFEIKTTASPVLVGQLQFLYISAAWEWPLVVETRGLYNIIKIAVLMVIIKLQYEIQHNGVSKIKMLILLISTQSSPLCGPWSKFSPWKSGRCVMLTPFSYEVARTIFYKLFGPLHHTLSWCAYYLRTGTNIHLPLLLLENRISQIWRYWSL